MKRNLLKATAYVLTLVLMLMLAGDVLAEETEPDDVAFHIIQDAEVVNDLEITEDAELPIEEHEDSETADDVDKEELFDLDSEEFIEIPAAQAALPSGFRLFGDIDGDGDIDDDDILLLNQFRLNTQTPTEEQKELGDINQDGSVDINDIFAINRYRLKGDTDPSAKIVTVYFDYGTFVGRSGLIKRSPYFGNDVYGETYTPEIDGYTFNGWYTEKNGGTLITSSSSVGTDHHILYAQYTKNIVAVTGISLNKSSAEIATKASLQLKATISPSNATDKTITWASSNASVASVNNDGKVTAKTYGKAIITASAANGKKTTCSIQTRFYDVKNSGKSYYDPVYWAVDEGITKCTVCFKPDDNVTRGEFTAFLWRMAGQPAAKVKSTKFSDVTSKTKFYDAICWAVGEGIIKGFGDGTFKPDDNLTRSQAAKMIWRYAGEPAVSTTKSPFKDIKSGNTETCKTVVWGNENGIMKGYSGGYFKPNDKCTRGNVVTFLYRYSRLPKPDDLIQFSEIPSVFTQSSGAGAWYESIALEKDGSFMGDYSNTDAGATGTDYPNGTCTTSFFKGKFSVIRKNSEHVYVLKTDKISFFSEEDHIYNGIKYLRKNICYFEDGQEYLLFLPGTPASEFPEGFHSGGYSIDGKSALPEGYYAICENADRVGEVFIGRF